MRVINVVVTPACKLNRTSTWWHPPSVSFECQMCSTEFTPCAVARLDGSPGSPAFGGSLQSRTEESVLRMSQTRAACQKLSCHEVVPVQFIQVACHSGPGESSFIFFNFASLWKVVHGFMCVMFFFTHVVSSEVSLSRCWTLKQSSKTVPPRSA